MANQLAEPYRAYNFLVEVKGMGEGHFTHCSGIGARVSAPAYREAGVNQIVRRLTGPVEYADVTLRYGLSDSLDLWQWFMKVLKGTVERRNVSIAMLNTRGSEEAFRWNLKNAWPCEWRGAPLDTLGREIAIETLTLVFDELERD